MFKLKQLIREEGPQSHLQKAGTPTMGGILIIPIGIAIGNLSTLNSEISQKILAISLLSVLFMFIGMIDDFKSLEITIIEYKQTK